MHHTPLQSHGALGVEVVQLVRELWGSTNAALMARSAVISPWTSCAPTMTTPALPLRNRSTVRTSCSRRRRCWASALLAPIPKGCPCRSPLSRRLPHHHTCNTLPPQFDHQCKAQPLTLSPQFDHQCKAQPLKTVLLQFARIISVPHKSFNLAWNHFQIHQKLFFSTPG